MHNTKQIYWKIDTYLTKFRVSECSLILFFKSTKKPLSTQITQLNEFISIASSSINI
jgi:hypothetical protein